MPMLVEQEPALRDSLINPAQLSTLPRLAPPPPSPIHDPDTYEVVVVGAGPAGMMLSAELARFGITSVLTVDAKAAGVHAGHADGLSPRTLEVLQSLDLAQELLSRGCPMHQVAFWNPAPAGIERTAFEPDVAVAARYPHEVTIHQGRIERLLCEDMARHGARVERGWRVTGFTLLGCDAQDSQDGRHGQGSQDSASEDGEEAGEFPVSVAMTSLDGQQRVVRTKYLVGADGAHSTVRRCMGLPLEGDTTDHVWGVADAVVTTTFPDIRKRCAIHSAAGSIMVIPRERIGPREVLTRIYCQIDDDRDPPSSTANTTATTTTTAATTTTTAATTTTTTTNGRGAEAASRARRREVTLERIVAQARRVMVPYTIDFGEVHWWAAYQIGQRCTPAFSHALSQRIHIAGDACHTHSPKAGQGMNVSMMDAHNLAFKLAHVLLGLAPARASLLRSYEHERLAVARQLIAFDTEFAALFSGKMASPSPIPPPSPPLSSSSSFSGDSDGGEPTDSPPTDGSAASGVTHEAFVAAFRANNGFTSGCGIEYAPSVLVDDDVRGAVRCDWDGDADAAKRAKDGGLLWPGRRLVNVRTTRFCDATPRDLHDDLPCTGLYRLLLLLPVPTPGPAARPSFRAYDDAVYAYAAAIPDLFPAGVLETAVMFPGPRGALEWDDFAGCVRERCEWLLLGDDAGLAYATLGVDPHRGAVAVVRPDGYVGCVALPHQPAVIERWLRRVLRSRQPELFCR